MAVSIKAYNNNQLYTTEKLSVSFVVPPPPPPLLVHYSPDPVRPSAESPAFRRPILLPRNTYNNIVHNPFTTRPSRARENIPRLALVPGDAQTHSRFAGPRV